MTMTFNFVKSTVNVDKSIQLSIALPIRIGAISVQNTSHSELTSMITSHVQCSFQYEKIRAIVVLGDEKQEAVDGEGVLRRGGAPLPDGAGRAAGVAAASRESEQHDKCEDEGKCLFHVFSPFR